MPNVRLLMRVEMPDQTVWGIPVGIVAQHRAAYYAKLDSAEGPESYNVIYARELMCPEADLLDWARGSMGWADVQPHARLLSSTAPPPDYTGWWSKATRTIVDGV